jgi:phage baseplate assembly protein W
MKLADIVQPNWSLSLIDPGKVVEGVDEISQCIILIVKTQKGTDPLRPDFGSDLFLYIDKPISEALPKIIKSIVDGINLWEQRVEVTKVSYSIDIGTTDFIIEWKEKITQQSETTKITVNGTN